MITYIHEHDMGMPRFGLMTAVIFILVLVPVGSRHIEDVHRPMSHSDYPITLWHAVNAPETP